MKIEEVKERFKDHELKEILITENLKVFEFRQPNTSNLFQRWIIDRGSLIVQGDCYDAIYRWNERRISLKFLAGCNLSYFSEKCTADKDGRNQEVFDREGSTDQLKEIAVNHIYDTYIENKEFDEIDFEELSLDDKLEICMKVVCKETDMYEWEFNDLFNHEFEYEVYDTMSNNEKIFGVDSWEYNFTRKTYTPFFHLAALRVAYEKYPDAF